MTNHHRLRFVMFTYSSLVIVVSSEPLRHLRGIRQLRRHVFTVRSHTLVLSRSLGEMLIHSTAMGDQNRRLTEMSAVVTVVILLGSKRSGASGIGADVRFIRRVHATNVLRDALRVFEHDSTSIHRARDRFRRIVDSLLVPLQHLSRGKRNGAHTRHLYF